jgi:hypothetical protein
MESLRARGAPRGFPSRWPRARRDARRTGRHARGSAAAWSTPGRRGGAAAGSSTTGIRSIQPVAPAVRVVDSGGVRIDGEWGPIPVTSKRGPARSRLSAASGTMLSGSARGSRRAGRRSSRVSTRASLIESGMVSRWGERNAQSAPLERYDTRGSGKRRMFPCMWALFIG